MEDKGQVAEPGSNGTRLLASRVVLAGDHPSDLGPGGMVPPSGFEYVPCWAQLWGTPILSSFQV